MQEATTTEITRQAFVVARQERAAAFTGVLSLPFRALSKLRWPQESARRWPAPPQGCPAGQ